MRGFVFEDAIRFRLATQQEDTGAKIQVFFGVLVGVLLRWIVVDVLKNQVPQNFAVLIARIVVALIATTANAQDRRALQLGRRGAEAGSCRLRRGASRLESV